MCSHSPTNRPRTTILLLEDDDVLAETLIDLLEARGFAVTHAIGGEAALDATFSNRFDLLLLDVNVPGLDGFTLLSELREAGVETPAIFITARTDIASLSHGFKIGADDYIKKPFDFEELAVRIDALLRKAYHTPQNRVRAGAFEFDIEKTELYGPDGYVPLPPASLKIVRLLFKERGHTVPKEALLEALSEGEESSEGALRVHIAKLRKLGLPIETVKGVGYRLGES
jgi:DNA-binding response OmpR family regulator